MLSDNQFFDTITLDMLEYLFFKYLTYLNNKSDYFVRTGKNG